MADIEHRLAGELYTANAPAEYRGIFQCGSSVELYHRAIREFHCHALAGRCLQRDRMIGHFSVSMTVAQMPDTEQ